MDLGLCSTWGCAPPERLIKGVLGLTKSWGRLGCGGLGCGGGWAPACETLLQHQGIDEPQEIP